MKKGLGFFIIFIALVFALALPAAAEYEEEKAPFTEETATDEAVSEAEDAHSSDNAFATLYAYIEEHAADIFSALAFISSALVVIVYKKGLLPALSSSISKISAALSGFIDNAKDGEEKTQGALLELTGILQNTEIALDAAEKRLDKLCSELAKVEKIKSEQEKIELVLSTEIDLLYEIFASSSLPQYRKDLIGERVAKMKSELGGFADEKDAT